MEDYFGKGKIKQRSSTELDPIKVKHQGNRMPTKYLFAFLFSLGAARQHWNATFQCCEVTGKYVGINYAALISDPYSASVICFTVLMQNKLRKLIGRVS